MSTVEKGPPLSSFRPPALLAAILLLALLARGPAAHAQDVPTAQPAAAEGQPPPDAPPPPPPPEPAPAATVDPARVDDIDQRSRILERKLELLEESAAARKTTDVVVSAN